MPRWLHLISLNRRQLLGVWVISALLSAHATAAGEKFLDSDVEFEDCVIGSGAASIRAQCGSISMPLDSRSIDGAAKKIDDSGAIDISIARIPAQRLSKNKDAFTFIAGGPGQSAIETYPSVAFAFRHIQRNHDIILIDQRGTGDSAKLVCENSTDTMGLDVESDPDELAATAKECLESLPHDPTWFTTSLAVHDIEHIRKALGVSQWNMYGISYGTRVATHYLRRYPDSIKTLILDAVVPPDVSLGPEISELSQRALDLIFERCMENEGCADAFGTGSGTGSKSISQSTMALLDALEDNPKSISFEDIATGNLSTMEFTRQHLAVTIRLMSYSAQTAAILPSMLHDAIENNNFAPLARQANLQTKALGTTLATAMHHSVICSEDAPFVNPENHSETDSYLGDDVVDSLLASCAEWPLGVVDADFKEPITSTAPVLILSGDADPITPPAYGDRLSKTLTNSLHIVNPDQGHMQSPLGCIPSLMAQFIQSADVSELSTECLERLSAPPFFIDANGPLP